MVRIVSMQFASEDNTDGMSKAVGQIKLSAGQAGQRKAGTLFGEEVECILTEDMCGTPSRKQTDEMEWKPLLNGAEMRQQRAAIDLMNVHADTSSSLYHSGPKALKIGLDRNSI